MVSLRYFGAAALGVIFVAIPVQSHILVKRTSPSYMGCYSSNQGLTKNDTFPYQSSGHCHDQCVTGLHMPVMAMIFGSDCWCGETMPPLSSKVSDSNCNAPCQGFPSDNCGGAGNYYAVYNSGLIAQVSNLPDTSSLSSSSLSSATSTTSSNPSVVTIEGSTVVVTAPSTSSPIQTSVASTSDNPGPNKAGIAAGVVVGIIAIAAIAGGIYFYIRARRRKEVEEEFKRQAAISSFVAGGKGAGSVASHDTRLDPVIMTQRRLSDGSIADNEDYSRRILKVTNA